MRPDPERIYAGFHALLLLVAGVLALGTFTVGLATAFGVGGEIALDIPRMPGRGW